MTLGSGGHGASSRSNSRNNYRAGKYSTSRMKLTGGGSSIAGTGGSHPLGIIILFFFSILFHHNIFLFFLFEK